MNRLFLVTVLMTVSLQGNLFAQDDDVLHWSERRAKLSKTDRTFNMPLREPNIRDFILLKNNKIILELDNVGDFDKLKNLDSLLMKFRDDIAFYKDSIGANNNASIRIDYVLIDSFEFRQMRFTRHEPNGDLYINRHGETSKLKLEQDTVRIIIYTRAEEIKIFSKANGEKKKKIIFKPQYTIQVTLCMDNYTDIDKLIASPDMLHHALDTLQSTKKTGTISSPYKFPSSSIYRPYAHSGNRFSRYNGLIKNELLASTWNITNRSDKLMLTLNMGAGLVRNTLTPTAEIGLSFYNLTPAVYTGSFQKNEYNTFAKLSLSPYFFFDKNASGDYSVHDNWFINFSIGGATQFMGITTPLMTGGIGYLLIPNGNVFKRTTMKAFIDFKLKKSITVCPELIFTNDFKQIFPGITLKLF